MAISEREFYAAHGLDMNPDKLLQEYTKYTSAKMLEVIRNEIVSASIIGHVPDRTTEKLKLIGYIKATRIALDIIDKHISDLTSEVSTDEKISEESGEEPSKNV